MTWHRQQHSPGEANRLDASSADPLDEKTPTSMYLPRFTSSIQMCAHSRADVLPIVDAQEGSGRAPSGSKDAEPSVIIAPELTTEFWGDGVAETVAVVRRRRSNAPVLALIAVLGGLFAISAGILLAELTQGHCSMWGANGPQSSAHGSSAALMH